MIGLLTAAALLLAAAGAGKLARPAGGSAALRSARLPGFGLRQGTLWSRAPGALELLVAASAIAIGGRLGAALLTAAYLVLAGLSIRLMSVARGADCGCFGKPSTISHWHTGVNLGYVLVGLAGCVQPPASLPSQLSNRPLVGLSLLLAAAALSYLSYLLMTALPPLLRAAAEVEVAR
jgi:hypothetical protein